MSGSRKVSVREEILAPLQGVLRWMLSLRDEQGRIMCPSHGVEHTGKSAGALVLALELAKHAPHEQVAELNAVALQQGLRLVGNLVCEENSVCHTFRPGRHDPFNCSNSVIDGGAAADALGQLVRELGPSLEPQVCESMRAACVLHAKSYLRYAVLDKGIPAQRAWGLTGLASATALLGDDDSETRELFQQAAFAAFDQLKCVRRDDGSYPYHPRKWGAAHPGAQDVSAYYQSRVTAFLLRALDDLGLDAAADPWRELWQKSVEFQSALTGPDGIKCGLLEAKPWYFGAVYEVSSHPFDGYTLARGFQLTGEEQLARDGVACFRAWARHLDDEGAPRSHLAAVSSRRSYQCPVFWAGHAAWLARAAGELEAAFAVAEAGPPGGGAPRVQFFEDAALVRLEDDCVVAWVRGRRPAYNHAHGSPHGGGLLRVVRKSDGLDLCPRRPFAGLQEGEWSGKSGVLAPARGWRAGAHELRFSLWLARVHWRAGRFGAALLAPANSFRRALWDFAQPLVSSSLGLDPELELVDGGVRLRVQLAHRGGQVAGDAWVEREFRVDGKGLVVSETLLSEGRVRSLEYAWPAAAEKIEDGSAQLCSRLS